MKTDRNIFVAFILNLAFAIFEFIGGILTGSIAVASDAVHDIGDAASIPRCHCEPVTVSLVWQSENAVPTVDSHASVRTGSE